MLASHNLTISQALGRGVVHPFPARMAPGIALDVLNSTGGGLRVLDPMAGSGTVLAVARASGHRAIGFDIDPLAVLISRVWTRTVDPDAVRRVGQTVLKRATAKAATTRLSDAYPLHSDEETREFVRFWFDKDARRQLAALSTVIYRVRDLAYREILWCAFSRMIIAKSRGVSLAMDLSHSRPHRVYDRAPVSPFDIFVSALSSVVDNCPQAKRARVGPPASVNCGDARKLNLRSGSIDLAVSSPPYLNAIDYMRCSKFSLIWMGYTVSELRAVRASLVGAEVACPGELACEVLEECVESLGAKEALSPRFVSIFARYVSDMAQAVAEVSRVLVPGGRAVYVVGDSTIRGNFVRNSRAVQMVAEANGLELTGVVRRNLPPNRRYLPPPSLKGTGSMDARLRQEVILDFSKR